MKNVPSISRWTKRECFFHLKLTCDWAVEHNLPSFTSRSEVSSAIEAAVFHFVLNTRPLAKCCFYVGRESQLPANINNFLYNPHHFHFTFTLNDSVIHRTRSSAGELNTKQQGFAFLTTLRNKAFKENTENIQNLKIIRVIYCISQKSVIIYYFYLFFHIQAKHRAYLWKKEEKEWRECISTQITYICAICQRDKVEE